MRGYESCPFHTLFTMEPAAVLTVADLRGRAITNWVQDVKLHVPFERSPPMEVELNEETVLPGVLFQYQLSRAVYQGTAAGGVKWWFKDRCVPSGQARRPGFDISIRYECRHSRKQYQKRATTDSRRSKHAACVECPVFVRFKGCVATDCPDTAVVLTATFRRYHVDPLKTLRTKFPSLQRCKFAEILASNKFAFIFESYCMAEDACVPLQGQEHELIQGVLKIVLQSLHTFSVWKLCLQHQRHLGKRMR